MVESMNMFKYYSALCGWLWLVGFQYSGLLAQQTGALLCPNGIISFFSKAPLEDISAVNKEVQGALDPKSGTLLFKCKIIRFAFPNKLMEEHFNENYLETTKYPSADYKGLITNLAQVDFTKPGNYTVQTSGELTLHGVKKQYTVPATLTVSGSSKDSSTPFQVRGVAKFKVKLADHNITVPSMFFQNIAEVIDVSVDMVFVPAGKKSK
jgi:hypothetical protein